VVEVGLGGGQVSIVRYGYGPFPVGMHVQASALRTWGSPWLIHPNQTFLGVELQASFLGFGGRLSFFRRVMGSAPGDAGFVIGGLTFGI
jgi:hypothetical protein